jgi:hypothetical protein
MHDLIMGLREDWFQLDERIETVAVGNGEAFDCG